MAAVLSYKRERSSACSLFSRHSNRYLQCQDWLGRLAWNTNNIFFHSIRTTRFRTFILIYITWVIHVPKMRICVFLPFPCMLPQHIIVLAREIKHPTKGIGGLFDLKNQWMLKKSSQISAREVKPYFFPDKCPREFRSSIGVLWTTG